MPRIFDPYFTTIPLAAGLGLATSFSIIKKHEGWITVESELKKESVFSLYLPARAEREFPKKTPGKYDPKGTAKVLIMDDMEQVLDVTREILVSARYHLRPVFPSHIKLKSSAKVISDLIQQ